MFQDFASVAHAVTRAFEIAGISVIVFGSVVATLLFLWRALGRRELGAAYHGYRSHLGRAILLGLELMVAADIISTVAVEPTFRSLGVLGLIVVIRTFLSFSLEVEINGHWPWQESRRGDPAPRDKVEQL
ncbi:MAG TPA: DUF1622 domain-containing protein [Longimicrobiaceae bacterium]|jgi:uncharacterized membrane protein